jgi:hypothetical protein
MMNELAKVEPARRAGLVPLFARHRTTFLMDAVLEGHMGSAKADDVERPHVARLDLGDVVMLGGDANHPLARHLVEGIPALRGIWPAPAPWLALLQAAHGRRLVPVTRYAFSDAALDPTYLRKLAARVDPGWEARRMDLELARRILGDDGPLTQDHGRNFVSAADFVGRGIGSCILIEDRIVSLASSYAICNRGIEVQVNTDGALAGRGLATAVSARLIVHCLAAGLAVHWDAANAISARLAEKLGYVSQGSYTMHVLLPA